MHGGRECTPWACVAYDGKKMLPISHWPAAELRPLGGPPCAVARRPVVWGVVSTRAPPCAGLVRVAPPRAASPAGKCPPHPECAMVKRCSGSVRVATPLASLILLLPLPYSCPHKIVASYDLRGKLQNRVIYNRMLKGSHPTVPLTNASGIVCVRCRAGVREGKVLATP